MAKEKQWPRRSNSQGEAMAKEKQWPRRSNGQGEAMAKEKQWPRRRWVEERVIETRLEGAKPEGTA